jgi:hypothetical protein
VHKDVELESKDVELESASDTETSQNIEEGKQVETDINQKTKKVNNIVLNSFVVWAQSIKIAYRYLKAHKCIFF